VTIQRTVPNIMSDCPHQSREFYVDVLGMVQLSVVQHDASIEPQPSVSIEVDDVDAVHAKVIGQGLTIVYPLTDEPWGVRRFFVLDPNGAVINILSHVTPALPLSP
jgi:catechol 2,3-dioxygenase-like lactoylglutathione lyase family enzyme